MTDLAEPRRELGARAVRSSAWLFATSASARLIVLLQVFVLARFLSPTQFGVIGMAFLMVTMLSTLTEAGLDLALIQRPGRIDDHLDTAWTVQVIRGTLLGLVIGFGAAPFADFFHEPDAAEFIRSFAGPVFLAGFVNIGIVQYKKSVEYQRLVFFELAPKVAGVVVTLTLAVLTRSIWALFFGYLVQQCIHVGLSYVVHPYRPRFGLRLDLLRDLFGFGKWIYLTNILLFALNQGDDIAVGRAVSATALGFYQVAFKIARLPVTEVNATLSKVLFPAFSELQHDTARLRAAYFKSLRAVLVVTAPFSFGIAITAPAAIPTLLGERWTPAVELVQVFALLGLLVSVGSSTTNIFRAVGKPGIVTRVQMVRAGLMFGLLFPMLDAWGTVGAAGAVVLSELTIGGYLLVRVLAELDAPWRTMRDAVWAQVAAAMLMVAAVGAVLTTSPVADSVLGLLAAVAIGAATYAAALIAIDRWKHLGVLTLIADIRGRLTTPAKESVFHATDR